MAKKDLKKFVAKDAEKFSERVKYVWEEGIDIALDQWDSFKKLDVKIQAAIGGGAALVVGLALVIVLVTRGPEEPPLNAGLDLSGVRGENYLIVENESEESLEGVVLVLDDAYIYRIENLTPGQQDSIKLSQFHELVGNLEEGATVTEAIKPQTLVIHLGEGIKTIELHKREKGFFERLLGG